jgi:WD40 repeat-containing protein SMU1
MFCRRRHLGTLPQSTGFDLLHGTEKRRRDEIELYPTTLACSIEFGQKSHPECAVFTPDGLSLISGSVDGFIEVWDASTGKMRRDLQFQAKEEFMMHAHPVLCLAVSKEGAAIAAGAVPSTVAALSIETLGSTIICGDNT